MLLQRGHSRKIFASHSTKKSFNYTVFIIRGITFKSSHSHKNDISVALPPSQVSFPVMGLGKWPCPRCAPWAFSSCFLPVPSCGGETESSWVGAGWWPRLTHSNQSGPICRKRNLFPKREAFRPGSCCSGSVVTVSWGVSPSKCTLRGQTLLLCGHTHRGFERGEVVFTIPSKVFTDTWVSGQLCELTFGREVVAAL